MNTGVKADFALGDIVHDKQTGFIGTVIAQTIYLHDDLTWGVQGPMQSDGKIPDTYWFATGRLEKVEP